MRTDHSSERCADILIIGGGVIGLLSARELVATGVRVTLLERQALAQESSWAGGGILSPLYPWRAPAPITELCRWSQKVYPDMAADLRESTGIDPEWIQSGLLITDCADIDQASVWCETLAVPMVFPEAACFIDLEPNLHVVPTHPLYLPDVAQVRNPRLLRALKADLINKGVSLLEHHAVTHIERREGRIECVVTAQGRFRADAYVIAAGAWSDQLGALDSFSPKVEPVKGQMLVFQAEPGLLRHIVLSEGQYLIPRQDGHILAGSTVEYSGFDKSTSPVAYDTLHSFALTALPLLQKYPVEKHWAGLRPGSPEGIPRIGPHPNFANLYFNCGHFRNGFVMAPASARLLTDQILNRPPILDLGPYRTLA